MGQEQPQQPQPRIVKAVIHAIGEGARTIAGSQVIGFAPNHLIMRGPEPDQTLHVCGIPFEVVTEPARVQVVSPLVKV